MSHRHKHLKHKLRHLGPRRSILAKPIFWLVFLALLMLGGLFYLFFSFKPLQVQTVSVSGSEKISGQDIENAVWRQINKKVLGISSKNILMVNVGALENSLLVEFPGLENVKVKKGWFKNIGLQVSERKAVAVFCAGKGAQECKLMDIYGVAFEPAYSTAGNLIVRQGELAVTENLMRATIKIKNDLKNNFQIDVREVFSSNPLIFTTGENWKIYFDPAQDLAGQATKLDLLLKNEITPTARKNLQYIYLQYKDRAYYK